MELLFQSVPKIVEKNSIVLNQTIEEYKNKISYKIKNSKESSLIIYSKEKLESWQNLCDKYCE